jgi:hypothetical protein
VAEEDVAEEEEETNGEVGMVIATMGMATVLDTTVVAVVTVGKRRHTLMLPSRVFVICNTFHIVVFIIIVCAIPRVPI